MKKRYIATPILVISVIAAWQITLQSKTQVANAEAVHQLMAPPANDPRHPIDVFQVGIDGGETEGDVLAHLSTTFDPQDKVSFKIDPKFGLGTIVYVERAMPVTIHYGRRHFEFGTWADTVNEALAEKGLELGDLDKTNHKGGDVLSPNMSIDIIPVAKVKVSHTEVIKYDTVDKDDPDTYRPETKVKESGENGERTIVTEITREDGIEVSRREVSNEITKKPKTRVIIHGTKDKIGKTSSGKVTYYDLCCTKVAANVFKKGTTLKLTNQSNGKSIYVKVDDTGAFGSAVVVDLAPDLFKQLGGTMGQGVIQSVKAEEILNP